MPTQATDDTRQPNRPPRDGDDGARYARDGTDGARHARDGDDGAPSSRGGADSAPSWLATSAALAGIGALLALVARGERRDLRHRLRSRDYGGGVSVHSDGRIAYTAEATASGRDACSPVNLPPRGWLEIFWRLVAAFDRDRITIVAAGVTFYAILSLFPLITAFVTLFGLFADHGEVAAQLRGLEGVVPAEALSLVQEQLDRLMAVESGRLTLTSGIALLIAFWSANNGVKGMIEAMNVAYDERENRSFILRNLTAMAMTLGAMAMVATLIALSAVLPALVAFFPGGGLRDTLLLWGRWPVMAVLLILVLAALYRFGPDRRGAKWRWITPGAVTAAIGLIAVSWVFSVYATQFANFGETYGSLGAVVAVMFWLWLSAIVVIVSAEINAESEHQTAADSTRGHDRPIGSRGAVMADNVASG